MNSRQNQTQTNQTNNPSQGRVNMQQNPQTQKKQKKKGKKGKSSNTNSTQNILNIAEIRDGLVIMNDGSFRVVIYAKAINFDLMSPQERENTEYAFQGFINSLYFSIQIYIRSRKVDMTKYLETLDRKRNEHENLLISILMDDYINYIDRITQSINIMDKKFYIIIPYYPGVDLKGVAKNTKGLFGGITGIFSGNGSAGKVKINQKDMQQAMIELKNRSQAILGGLSNTGIRGVTLSTEELIELYYDVYNPDTATRQHVQIGNINNVVIQKGVGEAPKTRGNS